MSLVVMKIVQIVTVFVVEFVVLVLLSPIDAGAAVVVVVVAMVVGYHGCPLMHTMPESVVKFVTLV